jgi:glycosyltransferase involved in cell wall biosynthesis
MIQPVALPSASPAKGAGKILFLVTEDWFFVSHFLSVAVAARAAGYAVAVAVRSRDAALAERIRAAGVELIPVDHLRSARGFSALAQARDYARVMREVRPDVVHLVSARLCGVGGLAARMAGVKRRVFAVTGLGALGARRGVKAAALRRAIGFALAGPLGGGGARFVFENRDDPGLLGLTLTPGRDIVVGGAGVDPEAVVVSAPPVQPPLKLALVARMVRSKGVDVAVEAVQALRRQGAAVELSLYGAPDGHNPESFSEAQLREFSAEPGVAWRGLTKDIGGVWREHHVALVPSLGGEGLPRALLEAAQHGRAIVTTTTPGCRDFVREGREGFLVSPGDAAALAGAISRFVAEPDLVARMGAAARARLCDGYTSAQVTAAFVALYDDMTRTEAGA